MGGAETSLSRVFIYTIQYIPCALDLQTELFVLTEIGGWVKQKSG